MPQIQSMSLTMKIISLFLTLICSYSAYARNPVGETANYELDRNRKRTSGVIVEGSSLATALREIKDDKDKKFYEINVHYKMRIVLLGSKEGDQPLIFPEIYFDEEFMLALRLKKQYEAKQFKVQHLGITNTQTKQGILYKDCDRIKLTDIKVPVSTTFADLISTLKKSAQRLTKATATKPENVVIDVLISPKVPVIGAVKIDIAGNVEGMYFSAGFDYLKPSKWTILKINKN